MKTILNLKDQKYTLNLNSQMAKHSRIITGNRTWVIIGPQFFPHTFSQISYVVHYD